MTTTDTATLTGTQFRKATVHLASYSMTVLGEAQYVRACMINRGACNEFLVNVAERGGEAITCRSCAKIARGL